MKNKKKLILTAAVIVVLAVVAVLMQKNIIPGLNSGAPESTAAEVLTDVKGSAVSEASTDAKPSSGGLSEDGVYDSKEDVALYIHTYGKLPSNYIKKAEAEALGWPGGELEKYAPGKCIGGDYFGNREGLLPKADGRTYTECDIDTLGAKSRGAKRIVFSSDGLIFYTEDHYESFTQLY